jgi:hypothetical protein
MPINGGCVLGLTTRDPGGERRELLYDQFAALEFCRNGFNAAANLTALRVRTGYRH